MLHGVEIEHLIQQTENNVIQMIQVIHDGEQVDVVLLVHQLLHLHLVQDEQALLHQQKLIQL